MKKFFDITLSFPKTIIVLFLSISLISMYLIFNYLQVDTSTDSLINKNLKFKGFIDGIIKVPKKRGTGHVYWIIDWKTSGAWGWRRDKKQDLGMTAQLILYKHFWAKKHNIDLKDIRCGFILLKRGGKPYDVANACVFLASDLANYISGQVLHVDGGMLT